jgi:hypothetical protein
MLRYRRHTQPRKDNAIMKQTQILKHNAGPPERSLSGLYAREGLAASAAKSSLV